MSPGINNPLLLYILYVSAVCSLFSMSLLSALLALFNCCEEKKLFFASIGASAQKPTVLLHNII